MSRVCMCFLCCFLVFLACSDVKQEKVNLSEVRVQKGISHKIDFDNEPLYPKGCLLIDSLLVVYDSDLEENFIKMYDINSNKLVKETGRIGGGPCDFSEVRFLVEYRLSTPYRTFALGDTNNLYAVNVDSLLGGCKKCENRIVEKIPRQLLGYNYILKNNDSLIIANLTGENQLVFYDKKTGSVRGENYYVPNPKINLSKFNLTNNVYGACFASKSDTIAIAYNNLKQIDFVTSKG